MGKIIKMPELVQLEAERKNNLNKLKILIDKYVPTDKERTLKKIKDEQ